MARQGLRKARPKSSLHPPNPVLPFAAFISGPGKQLNRQKLPGVNQFLTQEVLIFRKSKMHSIPHAE